MLALFSLSDGLARASPSLSLGSGCGRPFHVQMGRDMANLLPIYQPPSLVVNEVKQEAEMCKIEYEGKK